MIPPSLSEELIARLDGMRRLVRLAAALFILAVVDVAVAAYAWWADAGPLATLGSGLVGLLIMAASHLATRRSRQARRAIEDLWEEWHAAVRS